MSGFANAIIGGAQKLIRKAIQSPDFQTGVLGWSVNKDGTAEFNEVTVRGVILVIGTDGSHVFVRTDSGLAQIELQPPDQPGATFDPATINSQSDPDKSAWLLLTSPREIHSGGEQAQIQLEGSDGLGSTSIADVLADTTRVHGDLEVQGGLSVFSTTWQAWTPVVSGGGSATFSTRDGYFWSLGGLTFFQAYIQANAAGSGSATVMITLPVTPYRGTANRRQTYSAYLSATGTGGQNGPLAAVTLAGGATGIDQLVMSSGSTLVGSMIGTSTIITVQGWIREL